MTPAKNILWYVLAIGITLLVAGGVFGITLACLDEPSKCIFSLVIGGTLLIFISGIGLMIMYDL